MISIFISFLILGPASWSQPSVTSLPEKKLTATFLWSGDFSGAYDFAGSFNMLIKGEANQIESTKLAPLKNPENCDVSAHFSDVTTKFSQKNEPAYRFYFVFVCTENQKQRTTQTPAYFIRKTTLKGSNNRVHLSEKMKTSEFIVKEFVSSN